MRPRYKKVLAPIRISEGMKEELKQIKSREDISDFIRDAIQERLKRYKKEGLLK